MRFSACVGNRYQAAPAQSARAHRACGESSGGLEMDPRRCHPQYRGWNQHVLRHRPPQPQALRGRSYSTGGARALRPDVCRRQLERQPAVPESMPPVTNGEDNGKSRTQTSRPQPGNALRFLCQGDAVKGSLAANLTLVVFAANSGTKGRYGSAHHEKVEHTVSWTLAVHHKHASPALLEALREYWRWRKPRLYLFPTRTRLYERHSWGPKEADTITATDGSWHGPSPLMWKMIFQKSAGRVQNSPHIRHFRLYSAR